MGFQVDNSPDGGFVVQGGDGSRGVVRGNSFSPVGPSDAGLPPVAFQSGPGPSDAGFAPGPSDAGTSLGPSDAGAFPSVVAPEAPAPASVSAPSSPDAAGGQPGGNPYAEVPDFKPIEPLNQAGAPKPAAPAGAGITSRIQIPFGAPPAAPPAAAPIKVRAPQVGTGELDAAGKQAQAAEAQAGAAAAAKDKAVGEEQARQADLLGQFRDQYQQRAKELQAQGAARLQAMDKEIDGIGKEGRQIDPERWWKSRTQGQRVMATIAIALGGVAKAFGGENVGGKMIEDAIARDVDAQKFNATMAAQDRRDKMAAQQSAFGHFLALTGNEQAAQAATMAWGLKQADLKIEGLKSTMSAPEDLARANAMQAQIRERIAGEKAKLVELNSSLTTQALQQEGMRQQMAYQQAAREALARGEVPPELREQAVYDPRTGRALGIAPSAKEAESTRQMVGDADGLLQEIEEAKRLAQEWGSSSNRTQAGAAYKAKLDAIISKLNSAQGIQQAVGEEQRKLYMETFGNATTTPSDATVAGLNGLAQTLRTNVNARLRAFGPGMRPLYASAEQLGFRPAGGR